MRRSLGVLVAASLATVLVFALLMRARSVAPEERQKLAQTAQLLKVVQTEKLHADLRFAETNAELQRLAGGQVKLGRIEGGSTVVEVNVGPGGVIEFLLDKRDGTGQRLRAILLPQPGEPIGAGLVEWLCLSANWDGVSGLFSNCRFDKTAWEQEQRHIARLRAAAAQAEREADRSRSQAEAERTRAEADRTRSDLESAREKAARELERARQEEEREAAALAREVERAERAKRLN